MTNVHTDPRKNVIKYSAKRAYFGKLTAEGLDAAYKQFVHTQDWSKPITRANVQVGHIDGTVICRALWNEMSYNPLRFGTASPFLHNGKQDIFYFCRTSIPENAPDFKTLEKIQYKMIGFMKLNALPNGQWNDVINTANGYVNIKFVDGHSDTNYKILSKLREIMRLVTTQNTKDFDRKKYRTEMLRVIDSRHPNGIRYNNAVSNVPTPRPLTPEEAAEDRMDKAEENAQITAENYRYFSSKDYKQALQDLRAIRAERINKQNER